MRWIKLYTSLLNWEWSSDPNMVALWVHLLFKANYEDKRWRGMVVKRGQLITGRKALSDLTGISERTIRTCLARLVDTGEISIKSTNKFSIITICKYSLYQGGFIDDRPATDQQLTSNRPATDQQPTTTLEYVEYVDKVDSERERTHARTHEEAYRQFFDEQIAAETLCMQEGIDLDTCKRLAKEVLNDWTLSGEKHDNVADARNHLLYHLRTKINIYKRNNRNNGSKTERRDAADNGANPLANAKRYTAKIGARHED